MWWLTEGAEYRERYYGISKDDAVGAFIKHTTGTYQSQLKTPWNSRPEHQHVAQLYIALAVNMTVIFFFKNFCLMFSIPRKQNDLSVSNYFNNSMKENDCCRYYFCWNHIHTLQLYKFIKSSIDKPLIFFSLSLYYNYRDWKSVNSTLLLPKTLIFCFCIHINII